jgi:ribosomal protein S18 acetylase RimI-like enzyme
LSSKSLGVTCVEHRILTSTDAEAFRAIRLEGLRNCPTAFASSYDEDVELPLEEVAARISPSTDSWVLGAFSEHTRIVGCVGWYRDRGAKVRHKSHVWGMYVTPSHRRKGVARALLRELVARAKGTLGIMQIELTVSVDNTNAVTLYEAEGFRLAAILPNALFVDGRGIDEQLRVLAVASLT